MGVLKKKPGSRLLSCFSPSSETLSTCKSLDFTKKMQLSAIEMEFEPHSATKSFDITWKMNGNDHFNYI